jgi:hypothetical protein
MKMLETIMRLRDQGKLAEHNSTRQTVMTRHSVYLGVLMLLTACSATLEMPQQQGSRGTTGSGRGSPGNKWGSPDAGHMSNDPYQSGPYQPGPYQPGPYYPSSHQPSPPYPGIYQSSYQNNYQGNGRDSARNSSFKIKITSTQ